jgi:FixJ family two-component response regulator
LSHIKAIVWISVFSNNKPSSSIAGTSEPMKNQNELKRGITVIVVGDDLAVRHSLKFWLEIEGLTVRSYATGAELLSAGELARCDCLLIDETTPSSGLALIDQLRGWHFSGPAILIASHPSLSLRDEAEKAGIPIVEKPLLGNGLLDTIHNVTGNRPG